ncbi:MAG: divergent polysaccharide deacetylase family protein [candidate division KSB1 bacterium]
MKKYLHRPKKRLAKFARRFRENSDENFPEWQKALLAVFVFNLILLLALDSYFDAQPQPDRTPLTNKLPLKQLSPAEQLRLATDRVLHDFGIQLTGIEERGTTRTVRVPRGLNAALLQQKLIACLRENDATIQQSRRSAMEFSYARNAQTLGTIRLLSEAAPPKTQGKIAIVIDDFGHHDNAAVAKFINLPFAITYAIIPGLPHSQNIARKLERLRKTVIVHMPMEAMEKQVETNGYELRVGMSAEEIRSRVRKARALLPYAVGMNNHMGSRATQDEALLQALFEELQGTNYFFLDSRTIEATKAFTLAKANGLDAVLNDTFLDSVEELEAVRKKVWRLAEIAEQRGTAVGIGHQYPVTLQALQEIVPALQQRGFEFITIEQLLRPHMHATALLP